MTVISENIPVLNANKQYKFNLMKTGKVKWFNAQKGFGFIIQEDGQDIFVHFKDVIGGINVLNDGDEVEFEVTEGRKGLQAVEVKKL